MKPYRGKTKDGKWVKGWHIELLGKSYIVSDEYGPNAKETEGSARFAGSYFIKVIPSSVGQSTGLKDSEGVEIYKGDILQATRCQGERTLEGRLPRHKKGLFGIGGKFVVIYREGGYFIKKKGKRKPRIYLNSLTIRFQKLLIIGNATDNPELLGD